MVGSYHSPTFSTSSFLSGSRAPLLSIHDPGQTRDGEESTTDSFKREWASDVKSRSWHMFTQCSAGDPVPISIIHPTFTLFYSTRLARVKYRRCTEPCGELTDPWLTRVKDAKRVHHFSILIHCFSPLKSWTQHEPFCHGCIDSINRLVLLHVSHSNGWIADEQFYCSLMTNITTDGIEWAWNRISDWEISRRYSTQIGSTRAQREITNQVLKCPFSRLMWTSQTIT